MWRNILILAAFIFSTNCLTFVLTLLQSQGPSCFFEHMNQGQKYSYQIRTRNDDSKVFSTTVYRKTKQRWHQVNTQSAAKSPFKLQKLADLQGTFMFCVTYNGQDMLKVQMKIKTGFQLLEFQSLPDISDQQNLKKEIQWLQRQKNKVSDIIQNSQSLKSSAQQLTSLTSKNYIICSVVGIFSIIGINLFFYTQTKKALIDRKLI